jgi:CHAD domain-containing protein
VVTRTVSEHGTARSHGRAGRAGRARAFRLRRREAVAAGIRRIARGQIDAAVERLEGRSDEEPGVAVHEARKGFKRLRATVRLARGELGDGAYRRENVAFRDAGRRLAGPRDSQVLLETLDGLCERFPAELDAASLERFRAGLVVEHEAAQRRLRVHPATPGDVVVDLRAARLRVGRWRLGTDGFEALAPGLERIYGGGRRALRAARATPTDEHFHEWRKRVKDLWYAAQILRPAEPRRMKKLAARAHGLSNLLGADHDLAILRERALSRRADSPRRPPSAR